MIYFSETTQHHKFGYVVFSLIEPDVKSFKPPKLNKFKSNANVMRFNAKFIVKSVFQLETLRPCLGSLTQ